MLSRGAHAMGVRAKSCWEGGTILVCRTALHYVTQYTYTTLFEILSGPFLMIFPWEGGGIFWKGTFLWDNIIDTINIDSPTVVKPIQAQTTNIDSPIVAKPIEAQTNIDSLTIVVKPIEAPIYIKAKKFLAFNLVESNVLSRVCRQF